MTQVQKGDIIKCGTETGVVITDRAMGQHGGIIYAIQWDCDHPKLAHHPYNKSYHYDFEVRSMLRDGTIEKVGG